MGQVDNLSYEERTSNGVQDEEGQAHVDVTV
jgi:hypothetical protein